MSVLPGAQAAACGWQGSKVGSSSLQETNCALRETCSPFLRCPWHSSLSICPRARQVAVELCTHDGKYASSSSSSSSSHLILPWEPGTPGLTHTSATAWLPRKLLNKVGVPVLPWAQLLRPLLPLLPLLPEQQVGDGGELSKVEGPLPVWSLHDRAMGEVSCIHIVCTWSE